MKSTTRPVNLHDMQLWLAYKIVGKYRDMRGEFSRLEDLLGHRPLKEFLKTWQNPNVKTSIPDLTQKHDRSEGMRESPDIHVIAQINKTTQEVLNINNEIRTLEHIQEMIGHPSVHVHTGSYQNVELKLEPGKEYTYEDWLNQPTTDYFLDQYHTSAKKMQEVIDSFYKRREEESK